MSNCKPMKIVMTSSPSYFQGLLHSFGVERTAAGPLLDRDLQHLLRPKEAMHQSHPGAVDELADEQQFRYQHRELGAGQRGRNGCGQAHPSKLVRAPRGVLQCPCVADLEAIEAIKRVKYRYLRALDTKHWDDFADTLTEDIVGDYGSTLGKTLHFTNRAELVGTCTHRDARGGADRAPGGPPRDHPG